MYLLTVNQSSVIFVILFIHQLWIKFDEDGGLSLSIGRKVTDNLTL